MTHFITLLIFSILITFGFTSCSFQQSDPEIESRPACVTLDNYSYVIEQVMKVQPDWNLLEESTDHFQYLWKIEDQSGIHSLSTTLTSDGCVCAAVATSQFNMGTGKEEIVGLLQGAAVVPVSDLDYTASWLEPKLFISCGFAYLSRQSYFTEKVMKDETTWRLSCSRESNNDTFDSLYSLTVFSPSCEEIIYE
jgi:hypothetical protein